MDINKEREAFEEHLAGMNIHNLRVGTIFDIEKNEYFASDVLHPSEDHIVGWINFSWKLWQAKATPEGFVLVDKSHTENWYLDDYEGLYIDEPDNFLSEIDIGDVQKVEHKEFLITKSEVLYATKVWDDENQDLGTWEFFKNKEEADKAAVYCKAKFDGEAQEQSYE